MRTLITLTLATLLLSCTNDAEEMLQDLPQEAGTTTSPATPTDGDGGISTELPGVDFGDDDDDVVAGIHTPTI